MSEKPAEFAVHMDGGVQKAWNLTHIETETGPASVVAASLHAHAKQWQMLTFRLLPTAFVVAGGRE